MYHVFEVSYFLNFAFINNTFWILIVNPINKLIRFFISITLGYAIRLIIMAFMESNPAILFFALGWFNYILNKFPSHFCDFIMQIIWDRVTFTEYFLPILGMIIGDVFNIKNLPLLLLYEPL